MLAIAFLSFIGMALSFIQHARENKIDMNLLFPTILTISLWGNHMGLGITVIVFTGLVMLVNFATRD